MTLPHAVIEDLLRTAASPDQRVAIWQSSAVEPSHRAARVLLPGAFNPLHAAHLQMATVAAAILGREVDFEISVINVDKPPLDYDAVSRRVTQFSTVGNLWLTNAASFLAKATLFPHVVFVVGADTVARIAEPRYYGDDVGARDRALEHLIANNSRFLVFGRIHRGNFCSLSDLTLPAALRTICDEVPAHEFRADISSTELRGE